MKSINLLRMEKSIFYLIVRALVSALLQHKHSQITVPKGDILIHAGDVSKRGTAEEIKAFNECFVALPHPHKILIAGNHIYLAKNNNHLNLDD